MGKKSAKRGHSHQWGLHHGPYEHRLGSGKSSLSDSSSDSDSGRKYNKKMKKGMKKYWKHWHKFGRFGHRLAHFGHNWPHCGQHSNPMQNKAVCNVCRHQIRPMVDTEVLECGHIYHRLCLKGLFELALNANPDQLEVMCTQCEHRIDENLINELKARFDGQPNTAPNQVMDLQII